MLNDQVKQVISKLEERFELHLTKRARKRFLSMAGPSLLVMTFIEDGMRVFLRWGEQYAYMTGRMGFNSFFATIILLTSAAVQLGGSALVIRPSTFQPPRVKPAAYTLLGFTAVQPFIYGQATDIDFMCRSITLAGGLLLLIWAETERKQLHEDRGLLLQGESGPASDRFQFSGRLLLTSMFFFQAIAGEQGGLHSVLSAPGLFNIVSSLLLLSLSIMVCIGFKTEWSAILLTFMLGIANCWMYPFWAVHARLVDYYKYYFFQTLSVMGGLMLLTLHGPGGLSLDGQKKGL